MNYKGWDQQALVPVLVPVSGSTSYQHFTNW